MIETFHARDVCVSSPKISYCFHESISLIYESGSQGGFKNKVVQIHVSPGQSLLSFEFFCKQVAAKLKCFFERSIYSISFLVDSWHLYYLIFVIFCPGLQIATDTGANVTNIFSLAIKNSCWVATLATRFLSTSFPGFSPTRPTEQEGERPWRMLVTCLQKSGRVQANDLGEGQVSVRFVSTECSQVSAAMKLCTWPDLERQNKIMHKILWQRKHNFLKNIWMLIRCSSAMLSFGT